MTNINNQRGGLEYYLTQIRCLPICRLLVSAIKLDHPLQVQWVLKGMNPANASEGGSAGVR